MYKALLILLLASCAASKEPDSFKRAIVIQQANVDESKARQASMYYEHMHMSSNYPGHKLKSVKIEEYKGKTYDVYTVFPKGSHKTIRVYFDVTAFYNKHFK